MLAVLVVASALAGRTAPVPPLTVQLDAALTCPDRHAATAWQDLSQSKPRDDDYPDKKKAFEVEVARWVVCARLMGVQSYGIPHVEDPIATSAVTAALTEPGRRQRVEAIERLAPEMPVLAGMLALEELSVLEIVAQAEPPARTMLAAAAVGAWGCPGARDWDVGPDGMEMAWCTDGRVVESMARGGLERLVALAQPTLEMKGWLGIATEKRRDELWGLVEDTWFPLVEAPPVHVPGRGVGIPLDPGLGWSGRVSKELVAWSERPRFHMTRRGLEVVPPSLSSGPPKDWDRSPVLYVESDVAAGELEQILYDNGVARPRLIARREGGVDDADLVELRLLWTPGARVPPDGALVVNIGALGGRTDALKKQVASSDATGPVWLRVHPDALYGDVIMAQGAVASVRPGPVRFSVIQLDARSGETAPPAP
jgi:hypothetical protein